MMGEAAFPLDHPLNAVRVPPLYEITWERFQIYILMQFYKIHTVCIQTYNQIHENEQKKQA